MTTKLLLLTLLSGLLLGPHSSGQETKAGSASVAQIAAAAEEMLAALGDGQRAKVVFDFKDEAQRKRWSNLPTSSAKRAGVRLGDLTEPQRDAVWKFLKAAFSPAGYQKIWEIVQSDEVLEQRSGRKMFGRDEFYLSFVGKPSAQDPWMIQFGGHHLAINLTLAGRHGTLAPSHTAAQPAIFELEGRTIRPLGGETSKAFALITALDDAQRKQAILGSEFRDLVLGPGRDGQTIQPEGIKGSALTEKQREMLLDLISEWSGIMPAFLAKAKMEDLRSHITDTWFAWSGPTEKGAAAYFRVQGPTVIIELAPQRLGGDPTQHIHTIYREPANDYGVQWWKR